MTRQLSEAEAKIKLPPGGDHYTAYVGPPQEYDLMGATQFRLLTTLGLREHHKLLDFGCGSLRAGRLFLTYLDSGKYHGLEPNTWLIDDAITYQVGKDLVCIKKPHFYSHTNFRADECGKDFDFILAQSIFSHTGIDLFQIALQSFHAALSDKGIAVFTTVDSKVENIVNGWKYPGCVSYSSDTVHRLCLKVNLASRELPWYHPRQKWYIVSKNKDSLPLSTHDVFLQGAVLNVPSWSDSLK